jgi:hypothetical protein
MKITSGPFFPPRPIPWLALVMLVLGGAAQASENMTPMLLAVPDAPVAFTASDRRVHLVYELQMTNFSSGDITVEKVEVVGDGTALDTLDAAAVAKRLQAAGSRSAAGTLAKSTQALLFLNIALAPGAPVPSSLAHRVTLHVSAAPENLRELNETGGMTAVDRQPVAHIGPPLRGARYLAADSCCDATRHTRAALPVNGRVWLAQRYAVDWERLSDSGRIYSGPRATLESYAIFGQPVLAVADAVVVSTIDNQPEQTPGAYPTNIALDAADGNSITLDLGEHRYALYAHLQPKSLRVRAGDSVHRGQVIALVGDSGNSVVPHLHFQVSSAPSSLASNGLPYEIDEFQITGKTAGGTDAFDSAESDGTALPITPSRPPITVRRALPLDQSIVSFSTR